MDELQMSTVYSQRLFFLFTSLILFNSLTMLSILLLKLSNYELKVY